MTSLLLRRTRAEQVTPVYEASMAAYPGLDVAAGADPEDMRALLYPLGLAWRTEGIILFLQTAQSRFGYSLPLNVDGLQSLPGIGDYVSKAIVCFTDNQPVALIDSNVVRVLDRVFGIPTNGEARRRKEMVRLAEASVCQNDPAKYHYAILDFAALVCRPAKPMCVKCPLMMADLCHYQSNIKRSGDSETQALNALPKESVIPSPTSN